MNKSVVILVANGFDEVDFTEGQRAFVKSNIKASVISCEAGLVNSWRDNGWGHHFPVDAHVSTVLGSDYDCLFIPGGERSISKLSDNAHAKRIVRSFIDAGKPVAMQGNALDISAICERGDADIITGAGVEENPEFINTMIEKFTEDMVELQQAA